MTDEPRFLHRRVGYTTTPTLAMRAEPEAISQDDQDRITAGVRRRQHAAWRVLRDRLLQDIAAIGTDIKSPHVRRATRALEREVDALDRKLA